MQILRELKAKHPLFSNNQIETLLTTFWKFLKIIKKKNKMRLDHLEHFLLKKLKKKSAINPKTGD